MKLSIFESALNDLFIAGQFILPIVVKSPQGMAILNVSEQALSAILTSHAAAAAAVPAPPAVPAAVVSTTATVTTIA